MADTPTDVLVAGYKTIRTATRDFEKLVRRVKDKKVRIEGVILVTHDRKGNVSVQQTGDHLGRKGAGWGGGVGLAVGLLAPPLLVGSVATGAAAGALAGKFIDHRMEHQIHDKIGENLPPGSAGIIAVFDDDERLAVEQALSGALLRSVVQSDKEGISALKDSLAEAMGKFSPDRTVLPIPDRNFGGTIGRTMDKSVADWTIVPGPKAPDGAPNVLVCLIDDAGFGQPDTFGGPIRTPNLTRVQEQGVTYNRFHVTALCSPTRAALLTGRNHHRVGFGSIAEYPGPFPGYTAARPKSCTPLPRILRENGYVIGGFGKWHLTPDNVQGPAGPFDHWPQSWGFDHYWGFLSGAAGQYDPIITQDNTTVGVQPGTDGKPYYFPDDLTDKSIEWLHGVRAQDASKPWFMYYSTGCADAPHHVAKEWTDKYKGQFDDGWDKYRERTFARQKKLGVVPQDAELTERPDVFGAWDSLNEEEKRLYVRQMEVYAGYQENADWNVGRLLDAIDKLGDLDNTLVFYIWGDNGASMEGTITGSFNETTFLNGVVLEPEDSLSSSTTSTAASKRSGASTPRRTSPPHGRMPATRRFSGASRWPATSAGRATRWSSRGLTGGGATGRCARSSPTASTSRPRCSRRPASPNPSRWTGSSRSRWTAPASCTRSMIQTHQSATPSSTSSSPAHERSIRTAGGRARRSTGSRGISPRRR